MDRSTAVTAADEKPMPAGIDRLGPKTVQRRTRIDPDAIAARLLLLGWPERSLEGEWHGNC